MSTGKFTASKRTWKECGGQKPISSEVTASMKFEVDLMTVIIRSTYVGSAVLTIFDYAFIFVHKLYDITTLFPALGDVAFIDDDKP